MRRKTERVGKQVRADRDVGHLDGEGRSGRGKGGGVISSHPRRCSHISLRCYHPRFSHTFFGNLPFLWYRVNVDTFDFTRFGSRPPLDTKPANLTQRPPLTNNKTVSGLEHGRKTRCPTITALLSTPPFFHHQSKVLPYLEKYYISPAVPASFASHDKRISRPLGHHQATGYEGLCGDALRRIMPGEQ